MKRLTGALVEAGADLFGPLAEREKSCEAIGLELEQTETEQLSTVRRQRDRRMRELVLTAYEYRCAFCGYDGRIGTVPGRAGGRTRALVGVRWPGQRRQRAVPVLAAPQSLRQGRPRGRQRLPHTGLASSDTAPLPASTS
ncbi:hypothetical protein SNL152K_4757 [Streptomyces sp. NL15-2K]|nr:hypothetical protein SNL152K_4757 [Streptomyces sp. NL15-2K]